MNYENILVKAEGNVGIVQFNRPKALNALSPALMDEAMTALEVFDNDSEISCMIVTGSQKAFAAGADIREMAKSSYADMVRDPFIGHWDRFKNIKKVVIAAVSGYALGGGCEFAMACDMIIASESAQFGQPEINIGVIPGAGGTQRMTKAVGKALSMEISIGGRFLTAQEAERFGLVNHVFPDEVYLEEAIKFATAITKQAPLAVLAAKAAINQSFEMPLEAGIAYERQTFYSLFATEDQKEGMDAFLNKRKPTWLGK
ncbi:MAG: enoyl-CoA hydratase-related protein [Chloroflexota bacterium]